MKHFQESCWLAAAVFSFFFPLSLTPAACQWTWLHGDVRWPLSKWCTDQPTYFAPAISCHQSAFNGGDSSHLYDNRLDLNAILHGCSQWGENVYSLRRTMRKLQLIELISGSRVFSSDDCLVLYMCSVDAHVFPNRTSPVFENAENALCVIIMGCELLLMVGKPSNYRKQQRHNDFPAISGC